MINLFEVIYIVGLFLTIPDTFELFVKAHEYWIVLYVIKICDFKLYKYCYTPII